MSAIASKKAEQEKGPEQILFTMGFVFLGTIVVILILTLLFSWNFFSTNVLGPIIYFLLFSGLTFGFGSLLKETSYSEKIIKNWFFGFFGISIIIGIVLGAYMW